MNGKVFSALCAAAAAAAAVQAAAKNGQQHIRPQICYEDGCETFAGPARGYAPGGWTTFKPEGLPRWHGAKGYASSLWELSRFSGGREQGGRRPDPERVGAADIPLTDAMKNDVRRFLDETRQNGGSLIIRLGYTWSEQSGCEPADFDILLGHVRDLSKIMAGYPDVIVGVEAGVAGPWGEMHSSDYCKAEYMNRILQAYCDNLPDAIPVLVRAPGFVCKLAGKDTAGTLKMLPFKDGCLARLGMFNDGYLGTWRDYGTWAGDFTRERGVQMLKTFDRRPYGGELAYVKRDWLDGNRERCAELFDVAKWNIVKEWYESHLNYLRNAGVMSHPLCAFIAGKEFDVEKFRFDGMPDLHEYGGRDMHKFMYDHMGYRFVARDARTPLALARGRSALAAIDVENTGFGRLLLQSREEVLLALGDTPAAVMPAETSGGGLPSLAGGERRRLLLKFAVPGDVKPGEYGLYVRVAVPLMDEKPGDGPRRTVRFANKGMWSDGLKANFFGKVEVK